MSQQGTAPINGHATQPQQNLQQNGNGTTNPSTNGYMNSMGHMSQTMQPMQPAAPLPPPPVSMQNSAPQAQPALMPYSQQVIAPPPAPIPQYSSNGNGALPAINQNAQAVAHNAQQGTVSSTVSNQLQLLQQLQQQLAPEQFAAVVAALAGGITLPAPPAQNVAPLPSVAQQQVAQPPQNGSYNGQNGHALQRDDQGYDMPYRERSRSPDYKRRRVSPPNRRESPTYGVYDPNIQNDASRQQDYDRRGKGRGRGGRYSGDRNDRNEFRQRTPPRERIASPVMPSARATVPKVIDHDPHLNAGWIKGIIVVQESRISN
jgi:protein NRD1